MIKETLTKFLSRQTIINMLESELPKITEGDHIDNGYLLCPICKSRMACYDQSANSHDITKYGMFSDCTMRCEKCKIDIVCSMRFDCISTVSYKDIDFWISFNQVISSDYQ